MDRIIIETNPQGRKTIMIQRRFLWFFWSYYTGPEEIPMTFSSVEKAMKWSTSDQVVTREIIPVT